MTGHEPGRRYSVRSRTGRGVDSTAAFADAEHALIHFENLLAASGHSETAVAGHSRTLTVVLMKGGTGYTVLDPDLNGSVEIVITTR